MLLHTTHVTDKLPCNATGCLLWAAHPTACGADARPFALLAHKIAAAAACRHIRSSAIGAPLLWLSCVANAALLPLPAALLLLLS